MASTMSSLIPTSGSTVTRAADVVTIPSANLPWPTPNVIGPELVTNGTFDTDVSGWTVGASAIVSWDSGAMNVTRISSASDRAYQAISATIGATYAVSFEASGVNPNLRMSSSAAFLAGNVLQDVGPGTYYFVATSTVMYAGFSSASSGQTATFDNISVREIDPLAVSIQMDGRMDYSDEGIAAQQTFLRWYADANNYILWDLDTDSTATGEVNFNQASGGTLDTVASAAGALSPGVGTAFNIAGRHGSTFINGAVGGTVLTADTTPTSLATLSSTNMTIAHDMMGTIKTLRAWNVDLGDENLDEATT